MSIAGAARAQDVITAEEPTSFDGQGKPVYTSRGTTAARQVHEDAQAILSDGSTVRTKLTLYVPGTEAIVPGYGWRLTIDAVTYIVREVRPMPRLSGRLHHTRLRCREEET